MTEVLTQIIQILVSGIQGIATGVGSGLQTLAVSIFLVPGGTALSVFGGLVVVFAGIALAIGLCRWFMNFVTSLGN